MEGFFDKSYTRANIVKLVQEWVTFFAAEPSTAVLKLVNLLIRSLTDDEALTVHTLNEDELAAAIISLETAAIDAADQNQRPAFPPVLQPFTRPACQANLRNFIECVVDRLPREAYMTDEFTLFLSFLSAMTSSASRANRFVGSWAILSVISHWLGIMRQIEDGGIREYVKTYIREFLETVFKTRIRDRYNLVRCMYLKEMNNWFMRFRDQVSINFFLPFLKDSIADDCFQVRRYTLNTVVVILEYVDAEDVPDAVSVFLTNELPLILQMIKENYLMVKLVFEIVVQIKRLMPDLLTEEVHTQLLSAFLDSDPKTTQLVAEFFVTLVPPDLETSVQKLEFMVNYLQAYSRTLFVPSQVVPALRNVWDPIRDFRAIAEHVVQSEDPEMSLAMLQILRASLKAKVEAGNEAPGNKRPRKLAVIFEDDQDHFEAVAPFLEDIFKKCFEHADDPMWTKELSGVIECCKWADLIENMAEEKDEFYDTVEQVMNEKTLQVAKFLLVTHSWNGDAQMNEIVDRQAQRVVAQLKAFLDNVEEIYRPEDVESLVKVAKHLVHIQKTDVLMFWDVLAPKIKDIIDIGVRSLTNSVIETLVNSFLVFFAQAVVQEEPPLTQLFDRFDSLCLASVEAAKHGMITPSTVVVVCFIFVKFLAHASYEIIRIEEKEVYKCMFALTKLIFSTDASVDQINTALDIFGEPDDDNANVFDTSFDRDELPSVEEVLPHFGVYIQAVVL